MKITEEYRKLKQKWNDQAMSGKVKDDENPLFIFSMTNTRLLRKIASGKLDAKQLAQIELENRRAAIRTYYTYDSLGKKVKVTIPY